MRLLGEQVPRRLPGGHGPRRRRRRASRSSCRPSPAPQPQPARPLHRGPPHPRGRGRSARSGSRAATSDRYRTYSLGMRQRLAIAAALLKSPDLLILDEPTNGLDPAGIRDIRQLIRDLGASGVTVLLSSHILAEVQQVCDSVDHHRQRPAAVRRAASRSWSAARAPPASASRVAEPERARDLLEAPASPSPPTAPACTSSASRTRPGSPGVLAEAGTLRQRAGPRPRRPGVGLPAADRRRGSPRTGSGERTSGTSRRTGMRAVLVELSRCRSRRAVVALLLAMLALTFVVLAAIVYETRPLTGARDDARRAALRAGAGRRPPADRGVPRGPDAVLRRPRRPRTTARPSGPSSSGSPRAPPLDVAETARPPARASASCWPRLRSLVGATFAGADWGSGSMTNQLLFRPRRLRVWPAKAAAVTLGTTLAAAVRRWSASGPAWSRSPRPGTSPSPSRCGAASCWTSLRSRGPGRPRPPSAASRSPCGCAAPAARIGALFGLAVVVEAARATLPFERMTPVVAAQQPHGLGRQRHRGLRREHLRRGPAPSTAAATPPTSSPGARRGLPRRPAAARRGRLAAVVHAAATSPDPDAPDRSAGVADSGRACSRRTIGLVTSDLERRPEPPRAQCSPPQRHRRPRGAQAAAPRGAQRRDADRAQAGVDQDPRADGPGVHRAQGAGEVRGPAHGVPGGGLPQHLRVLGGPRGDLPHRRRPVHPALRLLPDRHRQAAAAGPRRAAPGGRERAEDAAALRHHHRRRPRRPARRRRLAVRRDGASRSTS